MSRNVVAKICECGKRLDFDRTKKKWLCIICEQGRNKERKELHTLVGLAIGNLLRNDLNGANHFLEQCEFKSPDYVGTLLVKICFYYVNMRTLRNVSPMENKRRIARFNQSVRQFTETYPKLRKEEIDLYESFTYEVRDIFTDLMVIFDLIGMDDRIDYLLKKMDLRLINDENTNTIVLKQLLARRDYAGTDMLLSNTAFIDKTRIPPYILYQYPDNENKRRYIENLFHLNNTAEAVKHYEQYLEKSTDSMATKLIFLQRMNKDGIPFDIYTIITTGLYHQMKDYDEARSVFDTIFSGNSQSETATDLIRFFANEQRIFHVLNALLDSLKQKNMYVNLTADDLMRFIDDYGWENFERVRLLDGFLGLVDFVYQQNEIRRVYQFYLNENDDLPEERFVILQTLIRDQLPLSREMVEEYILRNSRDREYKPRVVDLIFKTGFSKEYLNRSLLNEYYTGSEDEEEVKMEILSVLAEEGFRLEDRVMDQIIMGDSGLSNGLISRLLANGSVCSPGAISQYILRKGSDLSGETLEDLMRRRFEISPQAFITYLLDITDRDDVDKAAHLDRMIRTISVDALKAQRIRISFQGKQLRCSLLHGYLVSNGDSLSTARKICDQMMGLGMNINETISVDNRNMAFRRFAKEYRSGLSENAVRICDDHLSKKFSIF